TFVAPSKNYTLTYSFEVSNESGNQEAVVSRTVYFGLDNIELYNRKCDEALEPVTVMTTEPATGTGSVTTSNINSTTVDATHPTTTKPNNLGLILGLSLGLGIPALLVLVIGAYCYLKQGKRSSRYEIEDEKKYIPLKTRGKKGGASDNLTRYIY
ncbi:unnamed protein product, partial [Adineta ricciae]